MHNKLSQQASTTARDSLQPFWTQVHNLLQIFCPIFPSFAYRNCRAGTTSRKKEKKNLKSVLVKKIFRRNLWTVPRVISLAHICSWSRGSAYRTDCHMNIVLLITDTQIMLQVLKAKVLSLPHNLPSKFFKAFTEINIAYIIRQVSFPFAACLLSSPR